MTKYHFTANTISYIWMNVSVFMICTVDDQMLLLEMRVVRTEPYLEKEIRDKHSLWQSIQFTQN